MPDDAEPCAAQVYLEALNLDYLIDFMCGERYPLPRWRRVDAEHCASLYKNFLWLNKKHSGQTLVPTREIDEFWHNHILYTRQYARDCLAIFGRYLHHEPSPPDEDPADLVKHYLHTKALYAAEFGQELTLLSSEKK